MESMDSNEFAGGQSRKARESRLIRAQLTGSNGMSQDIFVRNLSRLGLGARAAKMAPVKGEKVSMMLPGQLAVYGVVRWRSGQHFGVELDAELEIEMVSEELRRHLTDQVPKANWDVHRLHKPAYPQTDPSKLRPV
jgi:hypothetical protein